MYHGGCTLLWYDGLQKVRMTVFTYLLDQCVPPFESPVRLPDLATTDDELLPPHLERKVHLQTDLQKMAQD